MGAAELRTAFNDIAEPRFTCTKALLDYERFGDVEYQRLTFRGVDPEGVPFEIRSDQLRPDTDVTAAARATAQALLNRPAPPSEPQP